MKHLILLNDPPYGTERSFNGLRMAHALAKNDPAAEITVFLMADAVLCAKAPARRRRMATTTSSACFGVCCPPTGTS